MTQVFIGAFYGLPLFSPDHAPSTEQLHSLEEQLLARYYLHRESLSSALLSYASLQGGGAGTQQYQEKVAVEYQQCFKTQVSLARLRNFVKATTSANEREGGEFELPAESGVEYGQCSISKLSKMVGCLVDALLALNVNGGAGSPPPGLPPASSSRDEQASSHKGQDGGLGNELRDPPHIELSKLSAPPHQGGGEGGGGGLSEEECGVLFYTLCIHGVPKMHARALALLVKYCGSCRWWGGFLVSVAANLFGPQQAHIFNKERYVCTCMDMHVAVNYVLGDLFV